MFCQLCGTKIEEGDLFCRNCGETSESLTSLADKPNLAVQGALFIGGAVAFLVALFAITQILILLDPGLRSPLTLIWILFIAGGISSGTVAVLLREYRLTRRKLIQERAKRRVLLSESQTRIIDANEAKAFPYSVVDQTTQKLTTSVIRNDK
jgi:zinc-ribbon domain